MTTTSRLPAVIDALIETFGTVTDLTVFDGPEFSLTEDAVGEFVIVGGNGDRSAESGSLAQTWAGMGHHSRNEEGGVDCALVVQTGDSVIKTSRDRVFVLLGELETALVADPTLGGAVMAGWMLPLSASIEAEENGLGSYVRLSFTISYRSRLEGS